MRKFLLLFSMLLFVSFSYTQTSLIYPQRVGNYYASFNDGGASFDEGTNNYQVGMWANTGGTNKQSVLWRKFRTDASNESSSDRALQIGDQFVVTLSCTRAYGQIGFALLASPAATATWDDRVNNYAIQVNLDGPDYTGAGYGSWYLRYKDGSTSATAIFGAQSIYGNFTFTMLLTAKDRMNVSISNGTITETFYDIQLNTTNPITDYSIYLENDWDGDSNDDIYWGLGVEATQHKLTATGAVSIGASDSDFEISTAIIDGYTATSSSTESTNSFEKTGSGTLTLSGNNTFSDNLTVSEGTLIISGNVAANNSISVANGATLKIDGANIEIFDLDIDPNGHVEVTPGNSLTVSHDLTINGTMTLKSDGLEKLAGNPTGSLITEGSVTGDVKVERHINGYTTDADGWHLLSIPFDSYTIATSDFDPGANDDLYYYDEVNDTWKNYKSGSFDFEKGKGYLCAYQIGATKSFTGTINNASVLVDNLTITGGGVSEDGWNLVGNPYCSAITWSNLWGTDIVATAKTYPGTGNYLDIDPGDAIPSAQGFFIQVSNATSMTIPTTARVHSTNSWQKIENREFETLKLKISGGSNTFSDICRVRFIEEATEAFDSQYDSHKLFGQASAPQLFTDIGDELLSTNTYANSDIERELKLNFIPGTSGEFTIEVVENSILSNKKVYLEDLFLNKTIDLSSTSEYHFNAEVGDNENRFKLHFGATAIEELQKESLHAYVSGSQLYIIGEEGKADLRIFNLQGQELFNEQLVLKSQYSRSLDLKTGIYFVSL